MKNKVLYISYTGMMEPLGTSQVLNYLYGLSKRYTFHLVSLEREKDYLDTSKKEKLKESLLQQNIHWYPLLYKGGMKGYLSDFLKVYRLTRSLMKKEDIVLLHCRSYMPTFIAYLLKKGHHNLKYIFDTRGFWFDEKADVGSLNRRNCLYKIAKWIERKMYLQADQITILSNYGKETILKNLLFRNGDQLNNITVIPTCVDLEKFNTDRVRQNKKGLIIGYVGTAVGWYNFGKTAEALALINKQIDCNLLVFNDGQHYSIKQELAKYGITNYSLEKVSFNDMPERMKEIDISLFFIHPFFSKRASSATKLGELFATGIPVITNAYVGDSEYYINQYSVGKIVDVDNLDNYNFTQIISELNTGECKNRCRQVAEKYFSLSDGINKYEEIYFHLLNQ
ncbi:MAG: glycosyltransferase [Bacteroidales bacterium]|jgi:glycosyltransferase involved in cell wall biosynthesis|nr:glycosyltransferase [Bacteroidales bacterium]